MRKPHWKRRTRTRQSHGGCDTMPDEVIAHYPRNPLVDPWPGDIVRSRFTRDLNRIVTKASNGRVHWGWGCQLISAKMHNTECSVCLEAWRAAMAGGMVIHVAPARRRHEKKKGI
jgi:hypothetical protein